MRHIHIFLEADAVALMPRGTVGVIVIHGDLPCAAGGGHWHTAAGGSFPCQHPRQCLRAHFGGIPGFQDGVQAFIRRVAGNGSPAEVNADHRLVQVGSCPDESILTPRQVNVRRVHALAHGGHGTGAVLAAQRQNDQISPGSGLQSLSKMAFVRASDGITVSIGDFRVGQRRCELCKQAGAVRLDLPPNLRKLLRFVALHLRTWHGEHGLALRVGGVHPGQAVHDRMNGFYHGQMGVSAKEMPCVVRVRADQGNLPDILSNGKHVVVVF